MLYQTLLDRCPHIPLAGMSHEEWLEKRKEGIGGSDAGAIMEVNPFCTPYMLYRDKKGLAPKTVMSRAARRGKMLEPKIREETMEIYPELEIETVPYMFTDPEYPFMLANIDGIIRVKTPVEIRGEVIEGLGGFEAKSARTDHGWTSDEIPDTYFYQVQHYMKVLVLQWFLVAVCILDDDESLYFYVIRRNEKSITRIIAKEKDFWENNYLKGIAPDPLGIDNEEAMITGEFEGIKTTIRFGEKEAALCAEHVGLNQTIKELEERKKAIAIMLKDAIINSGEKNPDDKKAKAEAGGYSISWSRFPRTSVDSDALKRDGVYDQYAKVSESGRFTVTKKGA